MWFACSSRARPASGRSTGALVMLLPIAAPAHAGTRTHHLRVCSASLIVPHVPRPYPSGPHHHPTCTPLAPPRSLASRLVRLSALPQEAVQVRAEGVPIIYQLQQNKYGRGLRKLLRHRLH